MLISEEYRKQQEWLHKHTQYGVASTQYAPIVTKIINETGFSDVLDYGAGRGNLAKSINPNHEVSVTHYDPARPEWAAIPDSHQMVCCIDVLEHIEPELLDDVLDDLQRVTELLGFFTVHTGPAVKVLPDGRNAHLIQQGSEWWLPKFMERFELVTFQAQKNGFYVLVKPYVN